MKRATRRAGGWQGWAAGLMVAGGAWLGVAEAASQAQTSATGAERTVPANARTSLVDLEQALGQARANRDKAMSDLTAVWRQLMASREELEQVRQQMDENARAVSRVRESERKLKRKTEEEEAARRQVARLQAEWPRRASKRPTGKAARRPRPRWPSKPKAPRRMSRG